MSGPIVRTGTNPKFWKNWDNIFGDKSKASGSGKKSESSAAAAKPAAKKKAAAKPAKKAGKKKS